MFTSPPPLVLEQESPVTDRKADVIKAAYLASEIAHRMVVPGGEVCHLLIRYIDCCLVLHWNT